MWQRPDKAEDAPNSSLIFYSQTGCTCRPANLKGLASLTYVLSQVQIKFPISQSQFLARKYAKSLEKSQAIRTLPCSQKTTAQDK